MSQDIYVVIEHLQGEVADISYLMLAAARELAQGSGGNVFGILLGHECQELARDLEADRVICVEHVALAEFTSDAYQRVLATIVEEDKPRAVLIGNTSIGADIASVLSGRLGVPLVGLCRGFDSSGRFISQICGGKIMAEGELPGPTALITMIPGGYDPAVGHSQTPPTISSRPAPQFDDLRVTMVEYLEPEAGDVDITAEPILIAVGRGVQTQDNIELVEELAELLNAKICGSRPIVDQGWLPTSRLVGKSGNSVKPDLYLAMGISGAPEHVEAITDSKMIIAVNTDPNAPIFDIANYGAEADMLDLTEYLIELVEDIKG